MGTAALFPAKIASTTRRIGARMSQLVRSGCPLRKSPSDGGLTTLFLSVSSCSEPTCLSTGGSYGFLDVDGCFIEPTIPAVDGTHGA